MELLRMKKCRLRNHKTSKVEQLGGGGINKETTGAQRGGGQKEKEAHRTQEQKQVETISTTKEEVFKIQHLEIEPQIELVEEEVKIVKTKI